MLIPSPSSRDAALLRALCIVVFITLVISAVYSAWIGIANFTRIGV